MTRLIQPTQSAARPVSVAGLQLRGPAFDDAPLQTGCARALPGWAVEVVIACRGMSFAAEAVSGRA
jgi:hypothetical protein